MDLANMQRNTQKYKTENIAMSGFQSSALQLKSKFDLVINSKIMFAIDYEIWYNY